ncbi:unnamed protein product, partial [Scytosiphon promiscuus]
QTAIFSTNFCTSARKGFFLIARNIVRVAAVSILGGFVLTIMTVRTRGALFVTAMTTVCAYYTGKMITSVYEMAITTILQCFVADERFPPSQQFAENDLKSWVDRHGTS